MYDTRNLKEIIDGHLGGSTDIRTCFSSWAADFMTAKYFSNTGSRGYIAILDTTLLEKHVRVYHVPALAAAGLTTKCYYKEYLVYGPVRGNGFHCVSIDKLSPIHVAKTFWTSSYGLFKKPPGGTTENDLKAKVKLAKRTAALFRPSHDKRPDIIIAMTAIFCCITHDPKGSSMQSLDKELFDQITSQLSTEIQSLKLPAKRTAEVSLANPLTYTGSFRSIHQMLLILRAVEVKARIERAVL
ncbi:hypothetical protein F5X99DRAFT_107072 [Biscogniauxia marginata]|nr:hypothetical protein F5X99DRAFT_107072 [Biscogniauxia marginata]